MQCAKVHEQRTQRSEDGTEPDPTGISPGRLALLQPTSRLGRRPREPHLTRRWTRLHRGRRARHRGRSANGSVGSLATFACGHDGRYTPRTTSVLLPPDSQPTITWLDRTPSERRYSSPTPMPCGFSVPEVRSMDS